MSTCSSLRTSAAGRIVRSVADDLAYAARPQSPSPAARARVLDAVAAAEAPILDRLDGVRFVRADHLKWLPGVFAGSSSRSCAPTTRPGG